MELSRLREERNKKIFDPTNFSEKFCASDTYTTKDIYYECLYQKNTWTNFLDTVDQCVVR